MMRIRLDFGFTQVRTERESASFSVVNRWLTDSDAEAMRKNDSYDLEHNPC
jgi:hypothetical protein